MLSIATFAHGAEFEIHPSFAVSEGFTDNVFETRTNRSSDYITQTLPGLAMSYKAPALTLNINYVFDYQHYARNTIPDDIAHSLSETGHLTAVKNLLFLDVNDEYQRVSLDVTRDVTKESLFVDQSDRNVVTASPYLMFNPVERIKVKAGYRFIDVRYFGIPVGTSVGTFEVDKTDHVAFMNMSYELSKRWSLTTDYTFARETSVIGNFSQHQVLGGFRYEYSDKSFVFAQVGNTWISYDNGQGLNKSIWNAGFTHAFDTVTGTVTTGVRYDEDPLSNIIQESFVAGSLEKRFNRGSLSFSPRYSEFVLANIDTLQTKVFGATVQGKYEFTADLDGSLGFTAERYDQPLLGSYTRRFQVDSRLGYRLAKQLTASLSYIYTDYYSPGIFEDNRNVSRAIIEIKKTF